MREEVKIMGRRRIQLGRICMIGLGLCRLAGVNLYGELCHVEVSGCRWESCQLDSLTVVVWVTAKINSAIY